MRRERERIPRTGGSMATTKNNAANRDGLSRKYIWLLGCLLLLGLFSIIANAANLLPIAQFPVSVVGACLEAVVTAIITVFLLKAQTKEQTESELKKERFAVLFAKKTETYEAFLNDLIAIANRGTITKEEFLRLIDDLNFKVAMYVSDEVNDHIAAQLDIIGKDHNEKTIKTCVFNIAQELKADLRADF
jgi:hypothetical protein